MTAKKSPPPDLVETTWGACTDADLLARILRDWPNARVFHEAQIGVRCGYPLWDMRPDDAGSWRTVMGMRDAHRMVCGAPTRRTEPPYCDACKSRIGARRQYTAEERAVQASLRRRGASALISFTTGEP